MSKKYLYLLITLFLTGLFITNALASNKVSDVDRDLFGNNITGHFYAEGNIGYATIKEKVITATRDDRDGLAFNLNGGYYFSPHLGLELGFFALPDENFGNGMRGENNYLFDLALSGALPITSKINLLAKLGPAVFYHTMNGYCLGSRSNTGSQSNIVMLAGLGVGFNVSPKLNLVVNAIATSKKEHKTPATAQVLVGFNYRF